MPLSFRQAGNLFLEGPNINIYPSGNTFAISGSAPSTGGGLTGLTSAGTGNRLVASPITNNDLIYKSLSDSSNLSINDNDNGTLTFSLAGGGTGTIISGVNVGTNANSIGFFTGLSTTINANDTLAFKNITGGPNINVALTANDGDILISRGSPTLVNQISPIGTGTKPVDVGARVLSAISVTNLLIARTISGNSGLTTSTPASPAITLVAPTNTTPSLLYISNATSQLTTNGNFGADATTGSLGIGGAAVTTTRLLLAAGNANLSQIRLTPFATEPTNPSDGSIWFSTSGNTLKFEKGTIATDFIFKDNNNAFSGFSSILLVDTGGTITPAYNNSFGKFVTLSSVTLTDTTTETSIISSILNGSTILLSSTNQYVPDLSKSKKYRFTANGTLVTSSLVNLILNIKIGSTVIGLVNNYGLSNPINGYFDIDYTFTIRSTGATGSVFGSGKILSDVPLNSSSLNSYPIGIYTNTTTLDTTTDQTFDCTVQFNTTGTVLTINEASLESLT
jgi:hypothetical protein